MNLNRPQRLKPQSKPQQMILEQRRFQSKNEVLQWKDAGGKIEKDA